MLWKFPFCLLLIPLLLDITIQVEISQNVTDFLVENSSRLPNSDEIGRQFLKFIPTDFALSHLDYPVRVLSSIKNGETYDYIIVGAGTAGSVVANSLSEDPSIRVLVLEAGGKEDIFGSIPGSYAYLKRSWRDYYYMSIPQEKCCGLYVNRQIPIWRGKLIGGTSSINGQGIHHCFPEDFNHWARKFGIQGWSYSDISPYFIKIENIKPSLRFERGYHGTLGHIPLTYNENPSELEEAFLSGVAELGLPIGDLNGHNPVTTGYLPHSIDNGVRYSSGRAYLAETLHRKNLDILTYARVDKILFDGPAKKAVGVEFISNQMKFKVFARKDIIISAGVFETPKLLILSGIGPAEELKSHGIPVLVDLPGVGRNLQDHPAVGLYYATKPGSSFVYTRTEDLLKAITDYVERRQGTFTSIGSAILGFYQTRLTEDPRPDLEIQASFGLPGGNEPLQQASWANNWNTDIHQNYFAPYEFKDGLEVAAVVTHPKSRGWVKLASSDPDQPPLIHYNYFDDPDDFEVIVEGIKLAQRIMSTKSVERMKPQVLGKVGACGKFPFQSEEYIRCIIPILSKSNNHQVGTARMGSVSDKYSVVDSLLRVKGVNGLRIADASVIPENVSGHPVLTIISIAERCVDFILGRRLRRALPPIRDESEILRYEKCNHSLLP